MRRLWTTGAIVMVTGGATALEVVGAWWAPDRGTPYAWFEAARDIQRYFQDDYRAAGYLYLYLRNDSPRSLTPAGFTLDGRPIEAWRAEHKVVWWRLLPRPLPFGAIGEVMVRLREAPSAPVELAVSFDDGSRVAASIAPQPHPLRIETVGFNEAIDRAFVVAEPLDGRPRRLARVFLDGRDVTTACRFVDPDFAGGAAGALVTLAEPLAYGSHHVWQVACDDGATAACALRAYDGAVPLGMYGYTTFEEYARNGCNAYNSFGRLSAGQLQDMQRLGLRAVMILGDRPPEPGVAGHPAVLAYGPMDEPDCHDYNEQDIPAPLRIGHLAPEMERRLQLYREADPRAMTTITCDLTYKPTNFYTYCALPDLPNVDCYPISIGAGLNMAREVVETARRAAGPRPLMFTYECWFDDPRDPAKLAARRFPRPPFAGEVRMMMLEAIGAGARGLFGYIHCTEPIGERLFRGAGEYPDLWSTIGRTCRELEQVAPLLSFAHPLAWAQSDRAEVAAASLLCGPDALLVVLANRAVEQRADAFVVQPQRDVRLTLPAAPVAVTSAWQVTADGFAPLALTGDPAVVTLPRLGVAEVLLLATDTGLAERLRSRFVERQRSLGAALLASWQASLDSEGATAELRRRLAGEWAGYALAGTPEGAYGVADERFWNPTGEAHPGLEFGQNEAIDDPPRGARWSLTVTADSVGRPHRLYAVAGAWGRPATWTITAPDGSLLAERTVEGGGGGRLIVIDFTPPAAGEYAIRFLQAGPGPKGGRVGRTIYVVPAEAGP